MALPIEAVESLLDHTPGVNQSEQLVCVCQFGQEGTGMMYGYRFPGLTVGKWAPLGDSYWPIHLRAVLDAIVADPEAAIAAHRRLLEAQADEARRRHESLIELRRQDRDRAQRALEEAEHGGGKL